MDQHYHDYGYRSQGTPSGEDGERLADRIISQAMIIVAAIGVPCRIKKGAA